jgi:RecA-family ATPase
VDLETDPRTLQKRVSRVAEAKSADAKPVRENLTLWPLRGKSCSLEEIAAELFCRCKAGDFGMVIIDPAYMVQDGDENNAKDIREFFAKLDEICVNLECTVVISHHHSKGAQGLKSAIDRGSGSGVFGRAPDAVLDMTELILEPGTLEMARQSHRLADVKRLTGWRMSFTLREFAQKDPLDLWLVFPLHEVDHTDLLADCKPNYGGVSEARKVKAEAENLGKVASMDAVCERLIGDREFAFRDEVQQALHWSQPTVNRWVDQSSRFMRSIDPRSQRATIVRRPKEVGATSGFGGGGASAVAKNDGATSGLSDPAASKGEGVQRELPIDS